MTWEENSGHRRILPQIFSHLVTLYANGILDFSFKALSELQILLIIIQLNLFHENEDNNDKYSSFLFLDLDQGLIDFLSDISYNLIGSLVLVYLLIFVLTFLCRVKSEKQDLQINNAELEYSMMLGHSYFLCYYINVVGFSLLVNSFPDNALTPLFILILLINNVIGVVGARFTLIKLRNENICSLKCHKFTFEGFLYKFLDVIIRSFLNSSIQGIARLIITALFLIKRTFILLQHDFYNYKVQEFFWILHGFELGSLLGALLRVIFGLDTNFCVFVSLLFGICLGWTFRSLHFEELLKWLKIPVKKLRTSYDFNVKLTMIEYLAKYGVGLHFEKLSSYQCLAFRALLKEYYQSLSTFEKKRLKDDFYDMSFGNYKKLLSEFINNTKNEIYQLCKEKLPHNRLIRLGSLYWQIQNEKDYKSSTILELMKLANSKSLEIAFLANKLLSKIYQSTYEKIYDEESVDINIVMEYIRCSSSLQEKIKTSTNEYYEFWSKYKNNTPMTQVLVKARHFEVLTHQINQFWVILHSKYYRNLQLETLLYALYMNLVRGRPSISSKLYKDLAIHTKGQRQQEGNPLELCLKSSHAITFIIQKNADGVENILFVTKSVEHFGYPVSEILNKGMSILLPTMYNQMSPPSITGYIEKIKGSPLGQKSKLYLRNKGGILYLMDSYMTLIAGTKNLTYLLTMNIESKIELAMVCNSYGNIEAWTDLLDREIGLTSLSLNKENNLFELFNVEVIASGNIIEIEESPKRRSPTNRKKSLVAMRSMSVFLSGTKKFTRKQTLSFDPQRNEYLQLIFKANRRFKYIARKSLEGLKVYLLTLERDLDSEKDESIPEERIERLQRNKSKVPDDTIVMNRKIETNFSSSYHIQHNDIINDNLFKHKDHGQGQIGMKTEHMDDELEKGINSTRIPKHFTFLNSIARFYSYLAISLVIAFLITSLQKIENIPTISNTAYLLNSRHAHLWEWIFFNSWTIYLHTVGLLDGRLGRDGQTYFTDSVVQFLWLNEESNELLYEIMENIQYFEPRLQEKFFNKVRVKSIHQPENIDLVTLWELDRMMIECGKKIAYYEGKNISELPSENPYLNFLNNNVLNDPYIVDEGLLDIVKEDIVIKMNYIEDFGISICIGLLVFSIIWFSLLVIYLMKLISHRTNMAEAFSKIGPGDLETHLAKVIKLLDLFESKNLNKSLQAKLVKEGTKLRLVNKVQKEERTLGMNQTRLNFKIYVLLALMFLNGALILGVSYLNLILFQRNQSQVFTNLGNSVKACHLSYDMITIAVSLYGYIYHEGNITMKNRPFTEVWDEIMVNLGGSEKFYLSLLEQVDDDLAVRLNSVFTQDLCVTLPDSPCQSNFVAPLAKHGALALHSFIFGASQKLKTEFDASNKTFADKVRIYYKDDYDYLDWIGWIQPAETEVYMEVLQTQVERSIEEYRKSVTISVSCFVGGFVVFLLYIWEPIKRGLEDQRNQVFETVRLVPLVVLRYNISMKTFWRRFILHDL